METMQTEGDIERRRMEAEHSHQLYNRLTQAGTETLSDVVKLASNTVKRRMNDKSKREERNFEMARDKQQYEQRRQLASNSSKASKGGSPKKKILKSGSPVNLKN